MAEYTVITGFAVVAVVVLELLYFKSGIFKTAQYWWTMVIVFAFQIPVDGWLTKLSAPIVIYNPDEILGLRAPWDIPIEDFGFGFAMVTLAILLWRRWLDRRPSSQEVDRSVEDVPLACHRVASVGNRAPPDGGEVSRGVLSSASDDDAGGSTARCASSPKKGAWRVP